MNVLEQCSIPSFLVLSAFILHVHSRLPPNDPPKPHSGGFGYLYPPHGYSNKVLDSIFAFRKHALQKFQSRLTLWFNISTSSCERQELQSSTCNESRFAMVGGSSIFHGFGVWGSLYYMFSYLLHGITTNAGNLHATKNGLTLVQHIHMHLKILWNQPSAEGKERRAWGYYPCCGRRTYSQFHTRCYDPSEI